MKTAARNLGYDLRFAGKVLRAAGQDLANLLPWRCWLHGHTEAGHRRGSHQ